MASPTLYERAAAERERLDAAEARLNGMRDLLDATYAFAPLSFGKAEAVLRAAGVYEKAHELLRSERRRATEILETINRSVAAGAAGEIMREAGGRLPEYVAEPHKYPGHMQNGEKEALLALHALYKMQRS